MLYSLCAFILGGKTPQSCRTADSTKGTDFVAWSFWTDECGGFFYNKSWGRCAGGINLCSIVGFSRAASFPNTGTRNRTQSSCWGLSTFNEPGVMLSNIMLTWSLYTQPLLSVLSYISGRKMPFSPSLTSLLLALLKTGKAESFGVWKGRIVNLMRKQKPWCKAVKQHLVKVTVLIFTFLWHARKSVKIYIHFILKI